MKKEFKLIFHLTPTSKERPRFTRSGHAFTAPKTRKFESDIKSMARGQWGTNPLLIGPLEACVTFQFKKPPYSKLEHPNKDLDNLLKACLDGLNKTIYDDDSQIVALEAYKLWGPEDLIKVVISEL